MPHPTSAFVRLLLRAYPRHLRQREADVLESACIECLARERLGRFGAAYACGRLIADTLVAAVVLRADERRRRRVAWAHVVAIINETFARRFWGRADPVGQRMAWGSTASHAPWMRIVGVVGDVKQGALNTEPVPHTYTPWQQVSDAMMADNIVGMMRSLRIAVRGEVEPGALAGTARAHSRPRPRPAGDVGADDEGDLTCRSDHSNRFCAWPAPSRTQTYMVFTWRSIPQ